ncbi:protein phosphatase CheZ [Methylobacterium dankookense]|uniref:Chemotaxis protein CheZ n=1 Tax=Methylobacterium dankookense TaxID=560405 RepID=A0A564G212_9HYPH|nr:protein phosphatase CheZ [Methylobacterium dankookense]GJD59546.1 hypothetical protein IFDJLNFL_5475 [Methylobacterium dankookense]VUF14010.1 hypothetical protein MTDSW087_03720 [Methylobacterium dankookense]
MSGTQSPILFAPDAYDVIAAAMTESERGRWFLEEHARRSRGPDTVTLLDAIGRIENAITAQRGPEDVGHLRGSLLDMANAISRTKAEIAAISVPEQDQSRLGVASEALDAIVRTTERATSDILGAAEDVQETAWTLRERGVDADVCDRLDRHATQIYTACSFQDLTAQRISRIVNTLRYLEDRLSAMITIWDSADERIPPGPETAPRAAAVPIDLSQSDVDRFIDMQGDVQAPEAAGAIARAPILLDETIDFLPAAEMPEAFEAEEATDTAALDEAFSVDADELAFAEEADDDLAFAAEEPAAEAAGIETAETGIVADLDDLAFAIETETETVAEPEEPASAEPRPANPARQTELDLGDIDLLSIEEKLALFS